MISGKLIFTYGAETDIKESYLWYETYRQTLGDKFVNEIDALSVRIQKNPDKFPEVLKGIRKANLKKFPFSAFFVISSEDVFVIAIFHNSRNPQIWKNRT
ncbi:MAG: type II toxin-antitoxin system RelE/ParE family toxin [Bacteroidetes bacterium]|nr:type II toxin-antitoxin system RelE/ParE family toxin [Bacteroidota bacterium]